MSVSWNIAATPTASTTSDSESGHNLSILQNGLTGLQLSMVIIQNTARAKCRNKVFGLLLLRRLTLLLTTQALKTGLCSSVRLWVREGWFVWISFQHLASRTVVLPFLL